MELTKLKKSRSQESSVTGQETTREQKQGSGVANEAQVPVKVSNLDRKDYLSLFFSNMPNPFESVLKKGMVFSVSSIEAVMHFLRVLVQLKGICRAFHLDEVSLLHLIFPFANGMLTNRVLAAIEDEKTLLDFHNGILNEFIPDRTRHLLFGEYFYRKQSDSETLLEYVEDLKVIEKVFVAGLTESQIVDAALAGARDPEVRAQYLSANRPQNFLQLDALCVRNQAILDSGALAGTTPTRSVVLGQGNRCFVCNKAGRFARECNRRDHVEQNQRKSEEVVRVVSREISVPPHGQCPVARAQLGGELVEVLLDTQCRFFVETSVDLVAHRDEGEGQEVDSSSLGKERVGVGQPELSGSPIVLPELSEVPLSFPGVEKSLHHDPDPGVSLECFREEWDRITCELGKGITSYTAKSYREPKPGVTRRFVAAVSVPRLKLGFVAPKKTFSAPTFLCLRKGGVRGTNHMSGVVVPENVGVSQETESLTFWEVVCAIKEKVDNWIQFPTTTAALEAAKILWSNKYTFPDAVGAVDCTHVYLHFWNGVKNWYGSGGGGLKLKSRPKVGHTFKSLGTTAFSSKHELQDCNKNGFNINKVKNALTQIRDEYRAAALQLQRNSEKLITEDDLSENAKCTLDETAGCLQIISVTVSIPLLIYHAYPDEIPDATQCQKPRVNHVLRCMRINSQQSIALRLKVNNFRASKGWLHRFKQHDITYKNVCDESATVSDESVDHWKDNVLPRLIEGYDAKHIFNTDETGSSAP
ncbi:hypothetical protein ANN_09763 [Periplaneta americana]|uniref:Uncharacterized protein n=1 Tax=Periplaneta americana TaxID=6978 RepID=A0ABQ8TPT5_PERAM|nr:hypothetical protein ANN_09763 [Periplaneta americana]